MSRQNHAKEKAEEASVVAQVARYLEKENKDLQETIRKLEEQNEKTKRDLEETLRKKVDLQETLDEREDEVKRLKAEISGLWKKVEENGAKMKENDEVFREEKEELKSEVQKLKAENSHLRKEIDEKTAKLTEKDGVDLKEKEKLRDEEQKLKEEIGNLRKQVQEKALKLKERDDVYVKQNKKLREKLESTQAELADVRQRLTRMASARIRAGNTALEDLSDPNRPSQLVLKWQHLFTSGKYWVVYEQVHKKLDDFSSAWLMYDLCRSVYDTCGELVGRLKKVENVAIRAWLEKSTDSQQRLVFSAKNRKQLATSLRTHLDQSGEFIQAFSKMSMTESEMDKLKDDLVEMCVRHMEKQAQNSGPEIRRCILQQLAQKPPPEALLQSIYSNLHHQLRDIIEFHHYEEFVKHVYSLCYRMLTMEIPMAVRFDAGAGSVFDPSLYENEDPEVEVGEESVINLVLRPPVLHYDGGPVLVKGLAQVLQEEEDKGSKPGTSPSALQGEASSPGRHTQGARGGPPAGDGNLDASPDETDETDEDGVGVYADRGTGGGVVSNDRRAETDGNNGDEDDNYADEDYDGADKGEEGEGERWKGRKGKREEQEKKREGGAGMEI